MLPNLQPYRAQERIYIYHTDTGNMMIQDISNTLDPKWFIVTPSYMASSVISPVLRQLNLPKKIYNTSIGGYVLDFLPIDVKNIYSSENYKEIGTFFNARTRKNEPLYIETNT